VHVTYKVARRIVVAVVGVTVLLLGLVMIVTPGPAIVVIPVGLTILSIEFAWARNWLKRLRDTVTNRNSQARNRLAGKQRQTGNNR
jgi:tellurite resistance protein TerC